jgi:hypothetical protein
MIDNDNPEIPILLFKETASNIMITRESADCNEDTIAKERKKGDNKLLQSPIYLHSYLVKSYSSVPLVQERSTSSLLLLHQPHAKNQTCYSKT